MSEPQFWSDRELATSLSKKLNNLKNTVETWKALTLEVDDVLGLVEMGLTEPDKDLETDLKAKIDRLTTLFEQIRLTTFLGGKYDQNDAILSIHAGAGGVDAQDWSEMLLRMYLRWAEAKQLKAIILEESRGTEAGIKSVVIEISGEYVYGYLKSEAGVHRLVRQSPFNSSQTRETSFALVEILPVIQTQQFQLNMDDVELEAKTSRGHGGQSVNTTYSAIRATHKPSGLTVTIQNERSQTQNKEQAIKILTAKVAALEEERQKQEKLKIRGEYHSAEWGNQIRSYVLHPYKMVKDHRTDYETSDTEGVLNGKIDELIKSYLEYSREKN